jgi:hypothetical protein
MTTRSTADGNWSEPVNFGTTINTPFNERRMWISADGLVLFFQSDRPRGSGYAEIYKTTRSTINDQWTEPIKLRPPVNLTSDISPIVSSDGRTLFFSSYNRDGGYGTWDLWRAPIIPVVDFTGDFQVSMEDLIIFIQHWGKNEPAYDMGAMPWGDGIIDRADLEVLMSYWGQEVFDPHLLAHWNLNENEGRLAHDRIAQNEAVVIGDAIWQPEVGKIDGAIQLDGINSHLEAPHILNPETGVFSSFAWVKGGDRGQVILSQVNGSDWLLTDSEGKLKTALSRPPKGSRDNPPHLESAVVITDSDWHRVGFVWDGDYRSLYVDDVLVATDTESLKELAGSNGGLIIGAAAGLAEGAFWSGLLDDVRIYDRVVVP